MNGSLFALSSFKVILSLTNKQGSFFGHCCYLQTVNISKNLHDQHQNLCSWLHIVVSSKQKYICCSQEQVMTFTHNSCHPAVPVMETEVYLASYPVQSWIYCKIFHSNVWEHHLKSWQTLSCFGYKLVIFPEAVSYVHLFSNPSHKHNVDLQRIFIQTVSGVSLHPQPLHHRSSNWLQGYK